jgi:hypothetical protein
VGETKFTSDVVRRIKKHDGAYAFNVHGSSYLIGHPDIVGSWHGLAFAIETKAEGKKLSKVQESVKRKMEKGGFKYFVVKTWDDYEEFVMMMNAAVRSRDRAINLLDAVDQFSINMSFLRGRDAPEDSGYLR